jgi:molybdenum cofactor biosynthesis enzyme MoaA
MSVTIYSSPSVSTTTELIAEVYLLQTKSRKIKKTTKIVLLEAFLDIILTCLNHRIYINLDKNVKKIKRAVSIFNSRMKVISGLRNAAVRQGLFYKGAGI